MHSAYVKRKPHCKAIARYWGIWHYWAKTALVRALGACQHAVVMEDLPSLLRNRISRASRFMSDPRTRKINYPPMAFIVICGADDFMGITGMGSNRPSLHFSMTNHRSGPFNCAMKSARRTADKRGVGATSARCPKYF